MKRNIDHEEVVMMEDDEEQNNGGDQKKASGLFLHKLGHGGIHPLSFSTYYAFYSEN